MLGNRAAQLERLRREHFDVLVVGGGITGAGVAWDAAARGLRVGLIERADFAGGTSSRSSKLIHGGLRYLAQGRVVLTREAVQERGRLQRLAPHLVDLLPFAFPIFNGPPERLKLAAGLWLYDAFAAGSGAPRHSWLGREETLAAIPGLRRDGLSGAFLYRDARTDDARMVLEVLHAAAGAGAAVANYLSMEGLLSVKGRAAGVGALDRLSGETLEVQARVVVLATGVWLDRVAPPSGRGVRVRPAKGVHLFLSPGHVPQETALYLSTTRDRRLVFVIPWLGRTMIGTTDTAYEGDLASPRATAGDVHYLLDAVNAAFPGAGLGTADVLSSQAGLRPLISDGDEGGSTAGLSREDRVFETEAGAIAIAGGKLTTFRRMAEKVVDLALRRLGAPPGTGRGAGGGGRGRSGARVGARGLARWAGGGGSGRLAGSPTAWLPLGGFPAPLDGAGYRGWLAAALAGAPPEARPVRAHLIGRYGARYSEVEALVGAAPQLGVPLCAGDPFLKAEALYAIQDEQAVSLADILVRRLRLALVTRDQGRAAAESVAGLLGRHLGWDAAGRARALQEYERDVAQYAVPA